jgi:hypothetical protein
MRIAKSLSSIRPWVFTLITASQVFAAETDPRLVVSRHDSHDHLVHVIPGVALLLNIRLDRLPLCELL